MAPWTTARHRTRRPAASDALLALLLAGGALLWTVHPPYIPLPPAPPADSAPAPSAPAEVPAASAPPGGMRAPEPPAARRIPARPAPAAPGPAKPAPGHRAEAGPAPPPVPPLDPVTVEAAPAPPFTAAPASSIAAAPVPPAPAEEPAAGPEEAAAPALPYRIDLTDPQAPTVIARYDRALDGGAQAVWLEANLHSDLRMADGTLPGYRRTPLSSLRTTRMNPLAQRTPQAVRSTVQAGYRHDALTLGSASAVLRIEDMGAFQSSLTERAGGQTLPQKIGLRSGLDTPVPLAGTQATVHWGLDFLHDTTVGAASPDARAAPLLPAALQQPLAPYAGLDLPLGGWGGAHAGFGRDDTWIGLDEIAGRGSLSLHGGSPRYGRPALSLQASLDLDDHLTLLGRANRGVPDGAWESILADSSLLQANHLSADTATGPMDSYEGGLQARYGDTVASVTGFFGSGPGPEGDQPAYVTGVQGSLDQSLGDSLRIGGSALWMMGRLDVDNDGTYDEDLAATRVTPPRLTAYAEAEPVDGWTTRLHLRQSLPYHPHAPTQDDGNPVEAFTLVDLSGSTTVGTGTMTFAVENLLNERTATIADQAWGTENADRAGTTVSLRYALRW